MLITRTSIATNITRTVEIDVTQAQIDAWVNGQLIQHAMPNLTDNEREFIMTGCSGDEWDQLMLEEEDDGYDHEDDYDYDHDDDCRSPSEKETHDRLDMGRNEAGEWLGFM
jgi:hypothetical protein